MISPGAPARSTAVSPIRLPRPRRAGYLEPANHQARPTTRPIAASSAAQARIGRRDASAPVPVGLVAKVSWAQTRIAANPADPTPRATLADSLSLARSNSFP